MLTATLRGSNQYTYTYSLPILLANATHTVMCILIVDEIPKHLWLFSFWLGLSAALLGSTMLTYLIQRHWTIHWIGQWYKLIPLSLVCTNRDMLINGNISGNNYLWL